MDTRIMLLAITSTLLGCSSGGSRSLADGHRNGELRSGEETLVREVLDAVVCEVVDETSGPASVPDISDQDSGECTNHTNCGDGWFSCDDGMMNASFAGHIPCWVSHDSDCEYYGNYWPCVSGKCGEHELCRDDIDYLKSLVPDDVEWSSGSLSITNLSNPKANTCEYNSCSWELLDNGEAAFEFSVDQENSWQFQAALTPGASNLTTTALADSVVKNLQVYGSPLQPGEPTLFWAPLDRFVESEGNDPSGQGQSGALVATLPDGAQLTIVWLWQGKMTSFAIHAPSMCQADCEGKECGDDGCGDSCGECGANAICTDAGTCACEFLECQDVCCAWFETTCDDSGCCEPNCEGKECGDDGCLGDCGQCPEAAPFCDAEGMCNAECIPDCEGKACGQDDGCDGKCGDCPADCTAHAQCDAGQLCLGEPDIGPPLEVCGLCGDVETCQCAKPVWPEQYACTTDTDCEQNFMCGNSCDDCPVTCPKCVDGWCAYDTFDDVLCLCSGCA